MCALVISLGRTLGESTLELSDHDGNHDAPGNKRDHKADEQGEPGHHQRVAAAPAASIAQRKEDRGSQGGLERVVREVDGQFEPRGSPPDGHADRSADEPRCDKGHRRDEEQPDGECCLRRGVADGLVLRLDVKNDPFRSGERDHEPHEEEWSIADACHRRALQVQCERGDDRSGRANDGDSVLRPDASAQFFDSDVADQVRGSVAVSG